MSKLNKKRIIVWILVFITITSYIYFVLMPKNAAIDEPDSSVVPPALARNFETDFSKVSVDLDLLLSGGPGKNGIPALSMPDFIPLGSTEIADTTRGILVDIDGEQRFYPYNILVWHEVVNDSIGDNDFAVTFCPLCGSAIVYNREVDGQILEFRVSGFLYESNMIMYDTKTESLWSQSLGKSVAGSFNQTELELMHFQLLELFEVKTKYPSALIMSTDTGHGRDYAYYPYGNYDNQEGTYFPVTVEDNRYQGKEIFYVINLDDKSLAFRIGASTDGNTYTRAINEQNIMIITVDGEISAYGNDDQLIPGYYEMWFSWATHHQEDGVVWDPGA